MEKRKLLFTMLVLAFSSMIFAETYRSVHDHKHEFISQDEATILQEADSSHVHLAASGGTKTCSKCKGSGKCPSCNGSGRCHYCRGTGYRGSGKSRVDCSNCDHGKCLNCDRRGNGKCSMCRGDGMMY